MNGKEKNEEAKQIKKKKKEDVNSSNAFIISHYFHPRHSYTEHDSDAASFCQ